VNDDTTGFENLAPDAGKPLRVLVSTSTFPLQIDDGLPRFVYDLSQGLARHCSVTALAPDAPGALRSQRMDSVDVRRFTYVRPRDWQSLAYGEGIRDNLRASAWCKLQPFPFVAAQTLATRSLVHSIGIDVVNSHWMIPQGLSSALARGRNPRFRHVLSVHAGDVYMLHRLPFGRQLARFIVNRSDVTLAAGSHVRDSLDSLLGWSHGARLEPMGAELDLFRDARLSDAHATEFKDGYLLFIGRFAEKKGIVYLLRAMRRLLERHPGLGLVLVGYGQQEDVLRREVALLEIERSVDFVGRKTHAQIAQYLKGCRLVVVPSVIDRYGETDGMPTVVIEAMASGARVVGTAVDGIPDIVRHGENGWLCPEKDPQALAEQIQVALDDGERTDIVRQGMETAENFDWASIAGRYFEVFEQLFASDTAAVATGPAGRKG
jgi:glycosyltransferase involved in cell wall biosynthesis